MLSAVEIDKQTYLIEWERPIDVSIPLEFAGRQPNAYGVQRAVAEPVRAEGLIGDTRLGGSCNFEQVTLIPHCNGTHTECLGHITHERISVRESLTDVLIPSVLVSVKAEGASYSGESYAVGFGTNDRMITRLALETELVGKTSSRALIVRTLPNDDGKLAREYSGDVIPPFFSSEAMEFVVDLGVQHLLVDVPSIDRLYDEGRLANHRIFWNIDPGKFDVNEASRINATITELIYVPDNVRDGLYLLNLQTAPFISDASPSRPVLFQATRKEEFAI